MVPVHMLNAIAQKETAKQAILKRLREADATSAAMPGSVEIDGKVAETALADLLASGMVREARTGLYYVDREKAEEARPGNGFVALLAILIVISFTASLVAIAATAG